MFEIHEKLYWEHLGVSGAVAISGFVLIGLALRLAETDPPRMHLWAMVAFFSVNVADGVESIAYSDVFSAPNWLYRWQDVIIPGFMVSLYFYVRALTSSKPALRPRDAVHILPFAVAMLCLLPALVLPGDVRRGLVEGTVSERHQSLVDIGETAFWAFWVVVLIFYGTLCARRLIQHKRNVRKVFSDLEGKSLHWLDGLVATILTLALIVIIDEIRMLFGARSIRDGVASLLFDIVLPLSFGVFALRANPVLPDWSADVLAQDSTRPSSGEETPDAPATLSQRYARSGLREDDLDRYAERLQRRMEDGRLWRDHGLNLSTLAAEIAVAPIHLSEVLNTKLGMTFYDYVNRCRIRDACALLIETDDPIIEISETVGFNAKSTFNTSFKKVTEQTPSQWRRRHRP